MKKIRTTLAIAALVALGACGGDAEDGQLEVQTPDVDVNVSPDTATIPVPDVDVGTDTDTVIVKTPEVNVSEPGTPAKQP